MKKIMKNKTLKATAQEDRCLLFLLEFLLLSSTASVILRIRQTLWTSLFLFTKKFLILNLKLKSLTSSNACSLALMLSKTHLFLKDIEIFHSYLIQLTKYFSCFSKTITSSMNISKEGNPSHLIKITILMKGFTKKSQQKFTSAFYAHLFVI